MKDDVVIVSATRTPVGAFNGAFASLPAHELGKTAIKAALDRAGVEAPRVSEVVMGQILTAGQGQNPARQASIAAGIPVETPAWGVNQLCGSGLRAVALGYQAIVNGDSEIVVAGGQESMSQAPHAAHLRNGTKMGGLELVDTMLKDEIVPVIIKSRKGDVVVDSDEYPRHGTTFDAVAKLRPAFDKDGTVTAGNASGINDGAAA